MKTRRTVIVAVGAAGIAWAVAALFFQVKVITITGLLATGAVYATAIVSRGFNTVGGVVLVLGAAAGMLAALDYFKGQVTARGVFLWSLFALVLALAAWVAGSAPLVSWLPGIPPDIQHAIGTPYVTVTETAVTNVPALIATGFIAAYFLLALALWVRDIGQKPR